VSSFHPHGAGVIVDSAAQISDLAKGELRAWLEPWFQTRATGGTPGPVGPAGPAGATGPAGPTGPGVAGPDSSNWQLLGGSSVVSTDINGGATIPWGVTVSSVLAVVVCGGQGWGLPNAMFNVDDAAPPTTTGFSIRARDTATNAFINGSVRVQWIALVVLP
jgi:hypothetical protein